MASVSILVAKYLEKAQIPGNRIVELKSIWHPASVSNASNMLIYILPFIIS